MAFEFRDILPAVGAVIGFGFGGPGGAALGSGIGSLARGDEADEAIKNAALGFVGGKGVQFLGNTPTGSKFLSALPTGASDFLQGGMNKDIFSTAIGKGKEFLGLDAEAQFAKKVEKYNKMKDLINANDDLDQAAKDSFLAKLVEDFGSGAEAEESLFNFRNVLGLGLFSKVFGDALKKDDKGTDISQFMVSTDTPLRGFEKDTPIKNVRDFSINVAQGGLMSLAKGGFPRRQGKIEGPGTETSDDIPAMLSDGEFVVNARTVRGIGESLGGSGKMDAREKGADFLYGMQERFGGKA
jgi:hypothetical protein|tara:strand:- start:148 stop:1038 length:891 start_codon:yes stop_codon:yes gene_type:complete